MKMKMKMKVKGEKVDIIEPKPMTKIRMAVHKNPVKRMKKIEDDTKLKGKSVKAKKKYKHKKKIKHSY